MKDNLNIENLFKQKFENFEGDVDPQLWNSISQGIGSSATTGTATGGISALVKTVLISGGIVAASLTAVYFSYDGEPEVEPENVIVEDNTTNDDAIEKDSVIIVENENDPVILQHKEEIERELNNKQYEDDIDESLVNQIIFPNGNNETVQESNSQDNNQDNTTNTENNENTSTENTVTENNNQENNQENNEEQDVPYPSGKMEYSPTRGTAPVSISFESNAMNYTSVKWSFGDGTTATGPNVKHTFTKPGEYTVVMKVVGKKNRVYEESKIITISTESSIDNIPNVITPDGDRINDIFSVNAKEIKTFFVSIRDVQGNAVFESNDVGFEWDGTNMMGEKVPSGTYIYTIIAEGEDGSVFKIPGQVYVRY